MIGNRANIRFLLPLRRHKSLVLDYAALRSISNLPLKTYLILSVCETRCDLSTNHLIHDRMKRKNDNHTQNGTQYRSVYSVSVNTA